MPKFAANLTMMFNEVPFLERFAAARSAGFEAVEFLFPYDHEPEEVAEHLASQGLTLALFNAPPGDWDAGERGLACVPEKKAIFAAGLETAVPYVKACGLKQIHVMCGIGDPEREDERTTYIDNMRRAADVFGEHGLRVLAEPINRRDIPGMFLHRFDLAADLIEAIDRPNVRLQFDVYHRQIIHGDVVTGLRAYMPLISHIQIADVPERHEPGTGEIRYERIFDELDRLDYDGWVGCEFRPSGTTKACLSWMER